MAINFAFQFGAEIPKAYFLSENITLDSTHYVIGWLNPTDSTQSYKSYGVSKLDFVAEFLGVPDVGLLRVIMLVYNFGGFLQSDTVLEKFLTVPTGATVSWSSKDGIYIVAPGPALPPKARNLNVSYAMV